MNSNYSVGERIRFIRVRQEMSQEQVALIAGVTPSYLGQVERDLRNVTVFTLEKICRALSVSLEEFFGGFDEREGKVDDVSNQILHLLNGRSKEEKKAVLRIIKMVFAVKEIR